MQIAFRWTLKLLFAEMADGGYVASLGLPVQFSPFFGGFSVYSSKRLPFCVLSMPMLNSLTQFACQSDRLRCSAAPRHLGPSASLKGQTVSYLSHLQRCNC